MNTIVATRIDGRKFLTDEIATEIGYIPIEAVSSYAGVLKVYSGSFSNAKLKVWLGGSWVQKPLKMWNGSQWVEIDVTGI